MLYPCDIEEEVRLALTPIISASAPPLPRSFQNEMPFCLITQTGGRTTDIVLDTFGLSVDVYADTWAQAKTKANEVVAHLRTFAGDVLNNVQWYSVDVESLPYNNPDPNNENLARCTFYLTISIRELEK